MIRRNPVTLALAIAVAVPLAACSPKVDHAKRAEEFVSHKKYKEAIVEYSAALKADERNASIRLALGDAYAALGNGRDALREYIRASDLAPKNVDAQLKAGAVLLLANKFKDAADRGDRALRVEPKNATALMLVANALGGMNNPTAAMRRLREAIAADPNSDLAYSSLGALALAQGDVPEADEAFHKAVVVNPDSVVARIALSQFYLLQGRNNEAEAVLKEAARLAPNDARVNRSLFELYMGTGRTAEAEAPMKAIAEGLPISDTQSMLADYYVRTNKMGQATSLLQKLAADDETSAMAKVRLAALSYTQGRAPEANKTVDEVLTKQPKNRDALLLRGQMLLREKKYDEALGYLKSAAEADPVRAAEPTILQANVYLSHGQLAEALAAFKEALRVAPRSTAAQLGLSKLYAVTGQNKEAMDLAISAVRQDPSSFDAHLNLEQRMFAAGDLNGAERELKVLQGPSFPPSASVQIEAAAVAAARKDLRGARAALDKATALDPGSVNALEGLIALDLAAQDRTAARTRVEARLKQAPGDGRVWYLAAQLYGLSGDRARQEEALRKTIELTPTNFQAFMTLGRLYGAQGKITEARRQFEAWMARDPRSVAARTMVGLLLEQERNPAAAQKIYEGTVEIDPRAAVAANNLAWMYTEKGEKPDEARKLAETATSQAPEIADFNDTLGWVYFKADLVTSAIPLFQKAADRDPANPMYQFHLGMARLKQHDDDQAKDALKKALAINQSFPGADEARKALASLD